MSQEEEFFVLNRSTKAVFFFNIAENSSQRQKVKNAIDMLTVSSAFITTMMAKNGGEWHILFLVLKEPYIDQLIKKRTKLLIG